MSNQGIFTVAKVAGDERRGQDDDEGPVVPGGELRKVQIENSYFEKLKARLGTVPGGTGPHTEETEQKVSQPTIYNDDGSVYRQGNT